MQIHVFKTNFHSQNTSQRIFSGTPPEAGRQNFERILAAIRERKKLFANRIREFDVCRELKRIKNKFISAKSISENLRPNPGPNPGGSRTANFERILAEIRERKKSFANASGNLKALKEGARRHFCNTLKYYCTLKCNSISSPYKTGPEGIFVRI